jgi:hypothetical protein
MFRTFFTLSVALGFCLLLVGQATAEKPEVDPKRIFNDLKEIALAYHLFADKNKGAAPAKAADLGTFLSDKERKRLLDLLENKAIVFVYDVKITDMTDGLSNTILAYEKDAPTKGGWVAYGDGSTKKLTADEFKKAIVAKPKKQR